mmetsp:Transcript_64984/g.105027  ORF Transcript_64984/g.105027 Transcript_64984/m.105027 type:complete len:246 (-) Transcript_64984:143-880(-)
MNIYHCRKCRPCFQAKCLGRCPSLQLISVARGWHFGLPSPEQKGATRLPLEDPGLSDIHLPRTAPRHFYPRACFQCRRKRTWKIHRLSALESKHAPLRHAPSLHSLGRHLGCGNKLHPWHLSLCHLHNRPQQLSPTSVGQEGSPLASRTHAAHAKSSPAQSTSQHLQPLAHSAATPQEPQHLLGAQKRLYPMKELFAATSFRALQKGSTHLPYLADVLIHSRPARLRLLEATHLKTWTSYKQMAD